MKKLNYLLFVCICLWLGACQGSQEQSEAKRNSATQTVKKIRTPELLDLFSKDEIVQLLDVRSAKEVKEGGINGAINIDLKSPNFEMSLDTLDKNLPVVVYCASGKRSRSATMILNKLGFTKVYDYVDGYNGWIKEKN